MSAENILAPMLTESNHLDCGWVFFSVSIGLIPSHHYVPVVTDELLR